MDCGIDLASCSKHFFASLWMALFVFLFLGSGLRFLPLPLFGGGESLPVPSPPPLSAVGSF